MGKQQLIKKYGLTEILSREIKNIFIAPLDYDYSEWKAYHELKKSNLDGSLIFLNVENYRVAGLSIYGSTATESVFQIMLKFRDNMYIRVDGDFVEVQFDMPVKLNEFHSYIKEM